jgi:hypothetical protein
MTDVAKGLDGTCWNCGIEQRCGVHRKFTLNRIRDRSRASCVSQNLSSQARAPALQRLWCYLHSAHLSPECHHMLARDLNN